MTPLDLSIVMISRNAPALTMRALYAVFNETKQTRFEVIVADLGEPDALQRVAGDHPAKPKLIRLPSDTPDARAINAAARVARGRYILLLDAGAVAINGAIDKIVAFAQANPSARIWSGRTLLPDGTVSRATCAQSMSLWSLLCRALGLTGLYPRSGLFNSEAYGGWQRHDVRETAIVSGGFFLVERELWGGLRGFDPELGKWGQDADLCLRARAFSARPLFTPDATVLAGRAATETATPAYTIAMLEARTALIARHWAPALVAPGLMMLSLWPTTRAIATTLQALVTGSHEAAVLSAHWRHVVRRSASWKRRPQRTTALETPAAMAQP